MNENLFDENLESEEIVLDDSEPAAGPLKQWLLTHTDAPEGGDDACGPAHSGSARRRWRGVAGGACALVLAAAAITAVAFHPRPQTPATHTSSIVSSSSDQRGELVSGTSSGCAYSANEKQILAAVNSSAPVRDGGQAIAVFEAAYYRARDGARARRLVAGSAAVADAPAIQAGIDSIPAGTTYCAHIRRLDVGLFAVEIHETRPGEPESVWRQQISTSERDGHTLITAITQL